YTYRSVPTSNRQRKTAAELKLLIEEKLLAGHPDCEKAEVVINPPAAGHPWSAAIFGVGPTIFECRRQLEGIVEQLRDHFDLSIKDSRARSSRTPDQIVSSFRRALLPGHLYRPPAWKSMISASQNFFRFYSGRRQSHQNPLTWHPLKRDQILRLQAP